MASCSNWAEDIHPSMASCSNWAEDIHPSMARPKTEGYTYTTHQWLDRRDKGTHMTEENSGQGREQGEGRSREGGGGEGKKMVEV